MRSLTRTVRHRNPIRARARCAFTRLAAAALKRVTSGASRLGNALQVTKKIRKGNQHPPRPLGEPRLVHATSPIRGARTIRLNDLKEAGSGKRCNSGGTVFRRTRLACLRSAFLDA